MVPVCADNKHSQLFKANEPGFLGKPGSVGNKVVEASTSDYRGGFA